MSQTLTYTCDACGKSASSPVGQRLDGFARVALYVLGIPYDSPAHTAPRIEALWCYECCVSHGVPYQRLPRKDEPQPSLSDLIEDMLSNMVDEAVETAVEEAMP